MSNGTAGIDLGSAVAADMKAALARKALHPTMEWMQTFLSSQRSTTPATALASTASFRLLAADIAATLSRTLTPAFPPDIHNVAIKERHLPAGEMIVQILDVEDIGSSRWEQIEAIEAIERGEGTKGRQLIRVGVTEENGQQQIATLAAVNSTASSASKSKGPHKVLLQDVAGATAYGIELNSVEGIDLGMAMGAKMVLRRCTIARGVILLEPSTVSWLGGKIEALHQNWTVGKKQRLLAAIDNPT